MRRCTEFCKEEKFFRKFVFPGLPNIVADSLQFGVKLESSARESRTEPGLGYWYQHPLIPRSHLWKLVNTGCCHPGIRPSVDPPRNTGGGGENCIGKCVVVCLLLLGDRVLSRLLKQYHHFLRPATYVSVCSVSGEIICAGSEYKHTGEVGKTKSRRPCSIPDFILNRAIDFKVGKRISTDFLPQVCLETEWHNELLVEEPTFCLVDWKYFSGTGKNLPENMFCQKREINVSGCDIDDIQVDEREDVQADNIHDRTLEFLKE